MKVLKQTVTRSGLASQSYCKEEYLPSGQSITKAIMMGGKSCCGAAYTEKKA